MNSISTRLLVSATLVLAAFVLLTFFTVRHSVHSRAEQALLQQLQGLVYGILGSADLSANNQLTVNKGELPDQRLLSPVTGLSAQVTDGNGNAIWTSPAVLPTDIPFLPVALPEEIGQWQFDRLTTPINESDVRETNYRHLAFATGWQGTDGRQHTFIVSVTSDATDHNQQLQSFDQNLWMGLLTSALLLLLVQLLILTWSLKPLGRIGRGLKAIESGEAQLLNEQLPIELKPLAGSINTLLSSERQRHTRYRHVIADLAHSLKTPLSVLTNLNPAQEPASALKDTVQEQTSRMHDIVSYHIQRAATDRLVLSPATSPENTINRLAASLMRIYDSPPRHFRVSIDPDFLLRLSEPDMMEAFGNIMDNSCKYGATDIRIHTTNHQNQRLMFIDDNGKGFGNAVASELVKRGIRADTVRLSEEAEPVEGQGLGLSIAAALFEGAGASVALSASPSGGARVSISLPG